MAVAEMELNRPVCGLSGSSNHERELGKDSGNHNYYGGAIAGTSQVVDLVSHQPHSV